MMSEAIILHGIPNCDSVKKAKRWLAAEGIDHAFHDVRKDGVDAALLDGWIDTLDDWGVLLNRRGTTWRTLDESEKADLDRERAVALMVAHPAIIKRPVLVRGDIVLVGFDETMYWKLVAN